MEKLSIDLDKKLTIMAKYELTAEEWLLVELLFLATEEEPHLEYMFKYFNECAKTTLPRETLHALQDKKILAASYKIPKEGEELDIEAIEFSKSFNDYYFKESQEAGQELWEVYPDFLDTGSKLLPAKNIIKGGFKSMEDFFFAYGKAIGNKREKHEKVLESLEWAKEHELIMYMIPEYVITRKWNDHIKMMESGDIGKFSVKFNTMEDI